MTEETKLWIKLGASLAGVIAFVAIVVLIVTSFGSAQEAAGPFLNRDRNLAEAIFDGSLVLAVAIVIHGFLTD